MLVCVLRRFSTFCGLDIQPKNVLLTIVRNLSTIASYTKLPVRTLSFVNCTSQRKQSNVLKKTKNSNILNAAFDLKAVFLQFVFNKFPQALLTKKHVVIVLRKKVKMFFSFR